MHRFALVSLCALACAQAAVPADPTPLEKQLAVQAAMASARKHLDSQQPVEAVAALEKEVANADGNKAFLGLLREAYLAELYQLEKDPAANPERLAQTRRKLTLLGAAPKPADPPSAVPGVEPNPTPAPAVTPLAVPAVVEEPAETPAAQVARAVEAFKAGNFAEADRLFAAVGAPRLTVEQKTAWGYCRIKLAADRVNAATCDPATAAAAAQSVSDALELVTDNAKLTAAGREVLKAAQAKAGGAKAAPASDAAPDGTSFRVTCADRAMADQVAKALETGRKQIYERWSGPPSGAWGVKCEVVVHATADEYAKATGKPAALTGHATITLANGRVTARRIDLRADDTALLTNSLPRELTHVVLADLFADAPPPRWALEGMAVLAGSPEEVSRYTRTLSRCARDGELRPLATLFDLKDVPADKVTGFYCQSVSVTEYLIGLRGERNFKIFLGDAQRYGTAQALRRQYNIDGPAALEAAWKRASLDTARGQAP
jgi:hypothetical protein